MKKSFVKVTNRGNVVKVIREHYLRDDIPCGVLGCQKCAPVLEMMPIEPCLLDPNTFGCDNLLIQNPKALLLPDTNLLLHYLDIFESKHFHNVVILQTVLDEVRHRNIGLYNRIRSIITQPSKRFFVFSNEFHRGTHIEKMSSESDNDRNDRAIRKAALWYGEHLEGRYEVLLLSNDAGNCSKALAEGINVYSLEKFVAGFKDTELMDVMERGRLDEVDEDKEHTFSYPEHLTPAVLNAGLKSGKYYQGSLHCSHYNAFEGTIGSGTPDSAISTITILGRENMNRAINGDTVVIELLPKDQWDVTFENVDTEMLTEDTPIAAAEETLPEMSKTVLPRGKVVGVIRRSGRALCGSIDRRSVKPNLPIQNVIFIAMDRRIPRIRIRTRQAEHLAGQRVMVGVDDWLHTSKFPQGHLIRQLGEAGDRATETEAILLEHDVAYTDFTPAVLSCLPSAEWKPTAEDYAKRSDFRELDICSVDPPGCTDIDDALHARPILNSKNYEVGVHIADVTHFVPYGSAIDKEASERATTVYLVDRRIDMLPGLLGTNLCSLKSDVERFAFSVIWEMTPDANVVSVRFTKSVISSKASLTYDQAQARLDDSNAVDPISTSLKVLNNLAKQLKERRIVAGALTLASPEVRFTIDRETQNPVDVELKEGKAANSMVEEFMLLANIYVAQELFRVFPDNCILRRHPSPLMDNFVSLNNALEGLEQPPLDPSSSRALADSLDRISVPNDPFLNKLIRIMTTRCMQQAVYFASGTQPYEQFWHYGLACPIYTHFTSPIRRYADIVVHRLLSACIDWCSPSSISWSKQDLENSCHNMNYRNRMAQQAQRSSVELFTHMYFKNKEVIEDAYVIKVMKNGFVALLASYGIEGVIPVEESASIKHDPKESKFVSTESGQPLIYLFQRVKIRAIVETNEATGRPKLKFSIADQGFGTLKRKLDE